jgi:WD40 repeat protein
MRCTRLLPAVGCLAAALLYLSMAALPTAAQNKQPVPETDRQAKARTFLHKIFAEDYAKAAKSLADRRLLAAMLRAEAKNATDSDALYFTVLSEAAELAAHAGDVGLAFEIVADIGASFVIDATAMKAAVLAKAAQTASEMEVFLRLSEAALALLEAAVDRDDFATAAQLRDTAGTTVAKTQNKQLQARLQRWTGALEKLQPEYDMVKPHFAKLKTNPKDPAANLAVGKYLCLGKGQWEKGLPLLLLCDDDGLRDVAQRDLAGPARETDRLALGDAYWDLSQSATDPARFSLQKRAAHWYGLAYAELAGINKIKVEKRLQAAGLDLPARKIVVGLVKTFLGHTRQVQSADISRESNFIVSGGDDDELRLWDAISGKEIKTFKGHSNQVWSVAFSPDGNYVLSSGEDQSVRLWDVAKAKEIKCFTGHSAVVNRVIFTPEGKRALSVSDDHSARLWDIDTGKEVMQFTGHQKPVWGASFTRDGSKLVSSGEDNLAIVWDMKTGKEVQRYGGHSDIVFSVAVSPDAKWVVSAGGDKVLHLWELETGKEVRLFEGHTGTVFSVAFSPDGKRILSSGQDQSVRLWDAHTAKQIHLFEGHTDEVGSVVFSADGRYAVSASMDMTVRLWGLPK